ncbi:hypothetical protein SAMD00023353_11900030 [Rosellinia necatrix]|uniref:Uncharacterized protein n=1 Tax=Rosellinia necatrix TaxID=77044 RepID=A0A1W2TXA0_ROSNE|nr:hypothetical protein SAMD00023353_11900030 [Rosellinia necatrix]
MAAHNSNYYFNGYTITENNPSTEYHGAGVEGERWLPEHSRYNDYDPNAANVSASNEPKHGPPSAKPSLFDKIESYWIAEWAAMALSWGFQAAILYVLIRMNNQPLEKWTGLISLNAAVAIFSTISRSLLLYAVASCISQLKWRLLYKGCKLQDFGMLDEASRGPCGALKLLLRMPLHLAALGAFTIIVSSALGPFTQQVIKFETRTVNRPIDSSASFGFAHNYSSDHYETVKDPSTYKKFDFALRAAFVNGLYNLSLTPDFDCPSSCVWPDSYSTLGFGYECANVTEATLATKECFTLAANGTQTDVKVDDYETELTHRCVMTTPGNVTIRTQIVPTMSQTVQYVSSNTHGYWNVSDLDDFYTGGWRSDHRELRSDFLNVAQYQAEDRWGSASGYYMSNVTECTVSLTAWDLSGVSAQGSSFSARREKIPLSATGTIDEAREKDRAPFFSVFFTSDNAPEMSISLRDWMSITAFMIAELSEIETVVGELSTEVVGKISPLQSRDTTGDITEWLDRVVGSMTDKVRSGLMRQLAYGSSQEQIVFVSIKWVWLALPLATELAALIVCIGTILLSTLRKNLPAWKSSPLALLFHEASSSSDADENIVVTSRFAEIQDLNSIKKRTARLVQ